jgi:1-deoxy-D-xylulose-5-phosphate synthase
VPYGSWEVLRRGKDAAILAVGTMVPESMKAAETLSKEGIEATVVNCRFMKPYDLEVLREILATHQRVLTVEEGAVVNGFGAFLAREVREIPEAAGVQIWTLGIPDEFIAHGSRAELLREIDLDAQGIGERVRAMTAGTPATSAGTSPQVGPVGGQVRETA